MPEFDRYFWNKILAHKDAPVSVFSARPNVVKTVLSEPNFRNVQLESRNIPWERTPQKLDDLLKEYARTTQHLIERRNFA